MEYVLLTKVGFIIGIVVKGGYAVAGGFIVKTILRYTSDYKTSIANEKEVG
jgi:hypothetical protein